MICFLTVAMVIDASLIGLSGVWQEGIRFPCVCVCENGYSQTLIYKLVGLRQSLPKPQCKNMTSSV